MGLGLKECVLWQEVLKAQLTPRDKSPTPRHWFLLSLVQFSARALSSIQTNSFKIQAPVPSTEPLYVNSGFLGATSTDDRILPNLPPILMGPEVL